MNKKLAFLFICICFPFKSFCESEDKVTGILAGAIPAFGIVYSTAIGDEQGVGQFVPAFFTNSSTTLLLKYAVSRTRPDDSDQYSFPSAHTSYAFMGASYLHFRYGLKFAWPLYVGAIAIGVERVTNDRHYWGDVFAGAALGVASSYMYTTPYGSVYPSYNPQSRTVSLNYTKEF